MSWPIGTRIVSLRPMRMRVGKGQPLATMPAGTKAVVIGGYIPRLLQAHAANKGTTAIRVQPDGLLPGSAFARDWRLDDGQDFLASRYSFAELMDKLKQGEFAHG